MTTTTYNPIFTICNAALSNITEMQQAFSAIHEHASQALEIVEKFMKGERVELLPLPEHLQAILSENEMLRPALSEAYLKTRELQEKAIKLLKTTKKSVTNPWSRKLLQHEEEAIIYVTQFEKNLENDCSKYYNNREFNISIGNLSGIMKGVDLNATLSLMNKTHPQYFAHTPNVVWLFQRSHVLLQIIAANSSRASESCQYLLQKLRHYQALEGEFGITQ